METARRLGSFFIVLAFILYIVFTQADPGDTSLRGQLVVYTIIFGGLGLLLLLRYRGRAEKRSTRFSWLRNFLFRSRSGGKREKKSKRSRRRDEPAIGDEEFRL